MPSVAPSVGGIRGDRLHGLVAAWAKCIYTRKFRFVVRSRGERSHGLVVAEVVKLFNLAETVSAVAKYSVYIQVEASKLRGG